MLPGQSLFKPTVPAQLWTVPSFHFKSTQGLDAKYGYHEYSLNYFTKRRVPAQLLCHSWLFATPWTGAHQAAISVEFSRVTFPAPGDLLDSGIESTPLALAGGSFTTEPPGKPFTRRQWSTILRMYRTGCHRLGSKAGKSICQYTESILSKLLLSLETKKTLQH